MSGTPSASATSRILVAGPRGVDRPIDHHERVAEIAQLVERLGGTCQVGSEQDGRFEGGDRFGRQRSLVADLRQRVGLRWERGREIGRHHTVAEPEREDDFGQVAVERDDAIDGLDRDDVAMGVGERDREARLDRRRRGRFGRRGW